MSKITSRIDMSRKQVGVFEIYKKKYAIYEGMNIIGRDMKATVLLKDVKFSKQHAIISVLDDATQFISDFGSCNGTRLRDELLEPYKFYHLTDDDLITLSDVTGVYHKLAIKQPTVPESQSVPDSQTCDHFALTQKLSTVQNVHDCPTQIYNLNKSIVDQINTSEIQGSLETQNSQETKSTKCDFKTPVLKSNTIKTQRLPIYEAQTQELPIHVAKTQGLALRDIENQNTSCTSNIPKVDDLITSNTQNTNENQLLTTNDQNIPNLTQNIELFDDVFANETFRLSLTNNNNTMYGVEVDETVLTTDKSKMIDSDEDSIDMLTEAATQSFVAQKSPQPVHALEQKLKSPVICPNRNLTAMKSVGGSDSETDIEDGLPANVSLKTKISALEKKMKMKKFGLKRNQPSKISPVENNDSETDMEDNVESQATTEQIVAKPKNRKVIESDSETEDYLIDKSKAEYNSEIIKTGEASNTIDASLNSVETPVDDDLTDIEDNNGHGKRKSIKNNIKTKIRVSSKTKTINANNAPVHNSGNNYTKTKNNIDEDDNATDDDLDLLAPTQKLSYFNTQVSSPLSTQHKKQGVTQLNNSNNPASTVDIHFAETQKLDTSAFADNMVPSSQFSSNFKQKESDVEATQDFDFLAPTQLLTQRPIQDSAPMIETQDVDFFAPTQLLQSTSKPHTNPPSQIEDDYLAPTQILLPILSGPTVKTLESKASASKNTDFYFGSKSPPAASQNESIFNAPTQKLTAQTPNLDVPTERLSAGDGILGSVQNEEDVFMAPTQMLSIPDGDGADKNNTTVSASDAMHLYLSEINEDDMQPTQKLDLSAFETKQSSSKPKTSEHVISETPKSHSDNNIDITTEKSIYTLAKEVESQLEVDFALTTQKLYVEEQTSRPNNPVANMFDEENTEVQDDIFDKIPVETISECSTNVEKLLLGDPEFTTFNLNDQTISDSESVSNDDSQNDAKSPEAKPEPQKNSPRKKKGSTKDPNKTRNAKHVVSKAKSNSSKPVSKKRATLNNSESSLDTNPGTSNALKRNLDEVEPISNKRVRKPSFKVMEKNKTLKGRKTADFQTLKKRRNTRQTIGGTSKDIMSNDDSKYVTSKGMGDSARKDKATVAHEIDGFYSIPTTSKAGKGDGSETVKSKFVAKPVQETPRTRLKRKSILVARSESDEAIGIIEDSDSEGSTLESFIKRKVLKIDDTASEYTSSSCSIGQRKTSGYHKIDYYSSDETEPSTSIVSDTNRYEALNVTSQSQNVKHKVAFTMLNDDKLEEKVEILGGSVTVNIYSSTVLVTNKISRSLKFLVAVSLAKPIVGDKWIKECMKKKRFLDPWDYLLEDRESETTYNFVLKDSIQRALKKKLLLNHTILLAVKKNFDVLKEIIETCGGKVISRAPSKPPTGIFFVVGYPDEPTKFSRYLKQKAPVVSAEAIFSGVLQQKMSINKHLLS